MQDMGRFELDAEEVCKVYGLVSRELGAHVMIKFLNRNGYNLGSSIICLSSLLLSTERDTSLEYSVEVLHEPISCGSQKRGFVSGKFTLRYVPSELNTPNSNRNPTTPLVALPSSSSSSSSSSSPRGVIDRGGGEGEGEGEGEVHVAVDIAPSDPPEGDSDNNRGRDRDRDRDRDRGGGGGGGGIDVDEDFPDGAVV